MANKTTVDPGKLTRFSAKILQKVGVPEEDAERTAGMLVATDLRGIDSHGVGHLGPLYVKRIKEGLINPTPQIKMVSHAQATAVMDGDRGLGFVVGYHAMTEALKRFMVASSVAPSRARGETDTLPQSRPPPCHAWRR